MDIFFETDFILFNLPEMDLLSGRTVNENLSVRISNLQR